MTITGWHMGRQWHGHDIEDECPCPKAPCGLVDTTQRLPTCEQHNPADPIAARTMRQNHPADACPARTDE